MTILYNSAFLLFSLFYVPYALLKGKWHDGFKKRLGNFPREDQEKLSKKKNIWVHAVSVGETLAVKVLIDKLKHDFPNCRIVCSVITATGYKVARQQLADDVFVIFAPLDFSWIVKKYIRLINPLVYISAETEIWPNAYTQLFKAGVPVVIVNGRISDEGFKGYQKISFITKKILSGVGYFCMQSNLDKQRIITLGADASRVENVGNIKFDVEDDGQGVSLADYGYKGDAQLFIAGSTHKGEEAIIIEIFKKLAKSHLKLRLVIVPRHIERTQEVCQLVESAGLKAIKYSDAEKDFDDRIQVLVVDEVGQLRALYKIGHCVFIGKSLVDGGGQNMIEPAFYGKPVWVGPYTQNFRDVMDIFLKEGGVVKVENTDQLYLSLEGYLSNPVRLRELGNAAQRVVSDNQGVTLRTVERIKKVMK